MVTSDALRERLPQLSDAAFITDGGMETTLIYHESIDGNPVDRARRSAELRQRLPALNVVGSCCGTEHPHIREICRVWSD